MNYYLIISYFLLMIYCFNVNADIHLTRDPFLQTINFSCQEQTDLLNKQIQVWQYKGYIHRVENHYQQLWLFSENNWLAITDNTVPHILFPWTVSAVLDDKLLWQASLPNYCNHTVLWTMPLTK